MSAEQVPRRKIYYAVWVNMPSLNFFNNELWLWCREREKCSSKSVFRERKTFDNKSVFWLIISVCSMPRLAKYCKTRGNLQLCYTLKCLRTDMYIYLQYFKNAHVSEQKVLCLCNAPMSLSINYNLYVPQDANLKFTLPSTTKSLS